MAGKTIKFIDPLEHVIDSDWLKTAFIVEVTTLQDQAKANIFSSYADRYFTDTSIGGSLTMNPPYQFTRYADIPRKGRQLGRSDVSPMSSDFNIGIGRYYADAIESNAEVLILEFGVPEFQSMFSFYTRAVDYNKSIVATEGRSTFFYNVGKAIGYAAHLVAFNVSAILIYAGIGAYKTLFGNGDTRYYHMKPAMPQYWRVVNGIATYLATERGVLIPKLLPGKETRLGMPVKIDSKMMSDMHRTLPQIFRDGNYIDVFAISQRAQVGLNEQLMQEMRLFKEGRFTKGQIESALNKLTGRLKDNATYEAFSTALSKLSMFKGDDEDDRSIGEVESVSGDPKEYMIPDKDDGTLLKLPIEKTTNFMGELAEYTAATIKKGGASIAITVEHVSTISDTFSNSTKEIPSKDKLNSLGGAARDIRFSMSGGNVLGDVVQDITNAAKDVAMGTLDSLTFGLSNVISALMGGGYITMPKMWDDSSVSLNNITYKVVSNPPYNNTITQIVDMDLILSMILAGVIPQSVGQSSYTSPFLCKSFLRGKQNIDFGMITSCTVTRGTSNVPFNKDNKALGMEITFTITDFSEIVSLPTPTGIFGGFEIGLDENNALNKFLGSVAGRDYHTSRYVGKAALLNASRAAMGVHALTSPAFLGQLIGDSVFGRLSSIAFLDTTAINLTDRL